MTCDMHPSRRRFTAPQDEAHKKMILTLRRAIGSSRRVMKHATVFAFGLTCVALLPLKTVHADPFTSPDVPGSSAKVLKQSDRSFSRAHDLVIHTEGLFLLVADLGNNAVAVVEPGTLKVYGRFGGDKLAQPHDLALGTEQRLYVASTGNDSIVVYKFKGVIRGGQPHIEYLHTWTDGISHPEGVDLAPDGRLYVTNTDKGTISVLDGVSGKLLQTFGKEGSGPGEFRRPHDIEVDANGRVIVVDSANHRIQIFDQDFNLQKILSKEDYGFNDPKYVSVDDDGGLLIADEYNHQIKWLDKDYNPIGYIGSGVEGDDDGELNAPEGVAIAGRYIWVSDTHNSRLLLMKRTQ